MSGIFGVRNSLNRSAQAATSKQLAHLSLQNMTMHRINNTSVQNLRSAPFLQGFNRLTYCHSIRVTGTRLYKLFPSIHS